MITKLKRALEALESSIPYHLLDRVYPPIEGLRTVIAQLEQAEPVAWQYKGSETIVLAMNGYMPTADWSPLYAAPVQPVREVLTDEEIRQMYIKNNWFDMNGSFTWGAASVIAHAIEAAHGITKD